MSSSIEIRRQNYLTPAAILVVGIMAVGAIKGCGNGSGDVQINPGGEVGQISVSDSESLILYTGKVTDKATEPTKIFGVNVWHSDKSSSAVVGGIAEVRTRRSAIKIAPYTIPGNHSRQGLEATVDADSLYVQPSMSIIIEGNKPQATADQQVFGLPTSNGVAKRVAIAEAGARAHFVSTCGKKVLETLPEGMKTFVQNDSDRITSGQGQLSGSHQQSDAWEKKARNRGDIKVTFTHNNRPINPADIPLRMLDTAVYPPKITPIGDETLYMNNLIGDSGIKMDPGGGCIWSQQAQSQFDTLTGQPNTQKGL